MTRYLTLMALLGAMLMTSTAAQAMLNKITVTTCDELCNKSNVQFKQLPQRKSLVSSKALGGEVLQGELAGEWDEVFGALAYPTELPGEEGEFFLVGMLLPAQAAGAGQYDVPGWHREGFFLDAGDGVPRLVAAALLDPEFVPEAGNPHTASGQLWTSQFVLYQEIEELERNANFYDSYPEGASSADLSFVTDDDGNVLELLVDIFDEFGEYRYTVAPQPGDLYNPGSTAFELSQPDFVYIGYFFDDLQPFGEDVSLVRDYIVPSAETDPNLPEGFDSADLEMFLILEGGRETDDSGAEFRYSTPKALGYTWGEANSIVGGDSSRSGGGALGLPMLTLLLGLGWARRRLERARTH